MADKGWPRRCPLVTPCGASVRRCSRLTSPRLALTLALGACPATSRVTARRSALPSGGASAACDHLIHAPRLSSIAFLRARRPAPGRLNHRFRGIGTAFGDWEGDPRTDEKQDHVIPDTIEIYLRGYLRHPETKSLAPDGSPSDARTRGLLGRASILATDLVPVGKETDRKWELGEDPAMLDFSVLEYREQHKMVIADAELLERMESRGIRELMQATGLSQHTLETIRIGNPVRRDTLARLRKVLERA